MARQSVKPTLEAIQAELADPDSTIRKEAITKIVRFYRKEAIEPLLRLLEDQRADV